MQTHAEFRDYMFRHPPCHVNALQNHGTTAWWYDYTNLVRTVRSYYHAWGRRRKNVTTDIIQSRYLAPHSTETPNHAQTSKQIWREPEVSSSVVHLCDHNLLNTNPLAWDLIMSHFRWHPDMHPKDLMQVHACGMRSAPEMNGTHTKAHVKWRSSQYECC